MRKEGVFPLLQGIRVVDFTSLLPGPYATLRLADLGAEVIKVEPPGGDPARHMGDVLAGGGVVFLANNRNKGSVVLDMKAPTGREQALTLTRHADVVLEGFRPGVADRLGIGYETVQQDNPGVIYCSLTGYGQTGPLAVMAGHDLNYMAISGMLSQFTDGCGRPVMPKVQLADLLGGVVASEAILAALVRRQRTGEGCKLDVAMTDALMGLLNSHALIHTATGVRRGVEELSGQLVCYHLYETKDGRTVSLAALEAKFWQAFCDGVGHPEWIPAQLTRADGDNPVFYQVRDVLAGKTLAEWADFGQQVDCCLQPVWEIDEALASQHAQDRGVAWDMNSSSWGVLRQVWTHAGGHNTRLHHEEEYEPPPLRS